MRSETAAAVPGAVAPLVIDAFGVPVGVQAPDLSTRERWERLWSRALGEGQEPAVVIEKSHLQPDAEHDQVDYTLTSRVTAAALAETKGRRWNFHACGLTDDEGRVLAMVAGAGTGKTTASSTLGRRLGYLSDETVSVGASLDVLPYAKPLSVVVSPDEPYRKTQRSPDSLGLLPATLPARLHRLVQLDRSTGPGRTGLDPLSLSESLAAFLPQSSFLGSFPWPLVRFVELFEAVGGAWRLRYREIGDHAGELLDLLAADTPAPATEWAHVAPPATPPTPRRGQVVRARWDDALDLGDAVAVLISGTLYQLDGLGKTIWTASAEPTDDEGLLRAAQEVHGDHGDAPELLREAVTKLEMAGLLHRS
ncbi:hypothetical protein [Nocardioides bigeumensis]|uniref:hypothetical protein n=1 Tax=Nocardioides bigeumensis TaxID=433657 RepID=UPI0031D8A8CE